MPTPTEGASPLARQVAGTFIEDPAPPQAPLLAWVRQELREGSLRDALARFCAERPEPLEVALAQVDRVDETRVYGHVPCRLCDHESPRTFLTQVSFVLDLAPVRSGHPAVARCAHPDW